MNAKTFYWLVKREFWENRGGFLWAPIITGCVIVALTLMGIITAEVFRSRADIHVNGIDFSALSSMMDAEQLRQLGAALDASMMIPASVVSVVLFFVLFFYCIHSLWDDRRDRSILFWKSLPISDLETVASKVVSCLVLAPVIAIIVSILAGWLCLLILAIAGSFHDLNLWSLLFTLPHPLQNALKLIALLPVYVLWALPCVGWLMLCSANARGRPTRWAIAVPAIIGVLVGWFNIMGTIGLTAGWYWTHLALRAWLSLLPGSWLMAGDSTAGLNIFKAGNNPDPSQWFAHAQSVFDLGPNYVMIGTPPFLIGIAVGIALLAAAVWIRGRRSEL